MMRHQEEFAMAEVTALVCVDMQYIHVHPDYSVSGKDLSEESKAYTRARLAEPVLPSMVKLQQAWRAKQGLLIHIVFNHVTPDGSDLDPKIFENFRKKNPDPREWAIRTAADPLSAVILEVTPKAGEIVLQKTTYSAFESTSIDFVLKNHGVASLVLVGGLTSCCVQHTAVTAKAEGYRIFTVPEADVDRSPEAHQKGLDTPGYESFLSVEQAIGLA
jgi:nicotinamidase-related amidase